MSGISREQALDCLRSDDLIGIGMEADAVRRRLHPEGVVTYAVEAVIACGPGEVEAAIAAAEEDGASGILLEAAGLALEDVARVIAAVKQRSPAMTMRGFSARELAGWGDGAVARLAAAGLDAIGGVAPEMVDEAWLTAQRAAHAAGLRTTARIVFGAGETFEERVEQLEAVRRLQDETGGFAAVAPVSFHAVGGRELDETTAVEYLKTLAVVRMYVENVENVQADWTTQGLKVLQMGLRFGANDVGGVGAKASEEELRRVIRDAGFRPAQRDVGYRAMMVV